MKARRILEENSGSEISSSEFKKEFERKATRDNKEFIPHRAYAKVIIANILIALTGIGALFVAGQLIYSYHKYGKAVGFFDKTKGIEKVNAIEKKIGELDRSISRELG